VGREVVRYVTRLCAASNHTYFGPMDHNGHLLIKSMIVNGEGCHFKFQNQS
jgi:hypothetical protein